MRTPFRKRRLTFHSNISFHHRQEGEQQQEVQRWTEQQQQQQQSLKRVSLSFPSCRHYKYSLLLLLYLLSPSFAQDTDTTPIINNTSPSIKTVKQIIAYALITIAILSLFGWGYIFYLRCQHHREESNEKCCVDLEKGVKLNTPPRATRVNHSPSSNRNGNSHGHKHGNSIDGRFDFTPQETNIKVSQVQRPPPQHVNQSYMSNSTYQPDEEEESQDSFARELSNAARQDNIHYKQNVLKKKVIKLHISKRDNEPIHDSSVFDVLGWKQHGTTTTNTNSTKKEQSSWGFNFDSAMNFFSPTSNTSSMDMPSPPVSYLPSTYTQKPSYTQTQSLEISDPGDVLLSDSSESSLWQSSTDGSDVFGDYRKSQDTDQYLLENDSQLEIVQDGSSIDPSIMSIQTESTLGIGKGAQKRGFYAIHQDNDEMEEYIPKEEYNAAVMAAQHVLKHSPRNSPLRMQHDIHQIPSIEPLPSAPSDEQQARRNLNISEQQLDVLSTSYEEDSVSFSYDPSFQTSLDTSSSGHLSKDIYKELKEVSKFIQKYEKKHTRSDKSELSVGDFNDSSTFDYSAVQSMSMSQPSLTMTSASASESESKSRNSKKKKFAKLPFGKKKKNKEVDMEVSEMEVKVKSKKKKRKKKFGKLPPRPHSHVKMQDDDEGEEGDHLEIEDHVSENDDDDVIVMSNPYRPNNVNKRRQLPVAGSEKYPSIGLSPSGESAASDAKFLHGEIDAFFTPKDTSMSIMSESIEVMHNPPSQSRVEKQSRFASRMKTPNKPPVQRPLQDPVTTSQSRFAKRMTPSKPTMKQKPIQDSIEEYDDSFDQDEDEIPHNSTFNSEGDPKSINESNRLGAAPFNANEYRARSNRLQVETELPAPKAVQVKTQRRENSRIASPILSSPKDTKPVYGTNKRTSLPINVPFNNSPAASPIAQSARSMIQNGAKSIQNMIDRSRNTSDSNLESSNDVSDYNVHVSRRNTRVADLEHKLQSGTRSFLSMFETKASDEAIVGVSSKDSPSRHRKSPSHDQKMTERIANRLEQIRRNVKGPSTRERSSSPSVNRIPSAPSSPERSIKSKSSNTMHPMGSTREYTTRQVMQMFDSSEEEPSPIRRNNRVQVATFVEPDQVLSPNAIQRERREQQVGRIFKPEIVMDNSQQSQQSGDDTTESPIRLSRSSKEYNSPRHSPLDRESMYEHTLHRNSERAASVAGESVASSSAQNLISMFESKKYSKQAIFPQSENWQHNGTFRKDKGAYRR